MLRRMEVFECLGLEDVEGLPPHRLWGTQRTIKCGTNEAMKKGFLDSIVPTSRVWCVELFLCRD